MHPSMSSAHSPAQKASQDRAKICARSMQKRLYRKSLIYLCRLSSLRRLISAMACYSRNVLARQPSGLAAEVRVAATARRTLPTVRASTTSETAASSNAYQSRFSPVELAKGARVLANAWHAQQQTPPSSPQELRASPGLAQMGAGAMAFAAATLSAGGNADVLYALSRGVDIYLGILTVRVLLTWFRNISWSSEPFRTLRTLTDPALNAFRGIIPPISGIDLSPMLLFFGLNFLAKQLRIWAYRAAVGA